MPILIDGYNLLFQSGLMPTGATGRALHNARRAMLHFLADRLSHEQRAATTVVFDAQAAPADLPAIESFRQMTVLYAKDYASADELLIALIRRAPQPRQLLVVSSDHQVQRAAKARRASYIDGDAWLQQLAGPSYRHPTPSPSGRVLRPDNDKQLDQEYLSETMDLEQWCQYFGYDAGHDVPRTDVARKSTTSWCSSHPSGARAGTTSSRQRKMQLQGAPRTSDAQDTSDGSAGAVSDSPAILRSGSATSESGTLKPVNNAPGDGSPANLDTLSPPLQTCRADENAPSPASAPDHDIPVAASADAGHHELDELEDPFPPGYAEPLPPRQRRRKRSHRR